jgi:hypothetical protein
MLTGILTYLLQNVKLRIVDIIVFAVVFIPPALQSVLQANSYIDAISQALSFKTFVLIIAFLVLIFLTRQVWPWYVQNQAAKLEIEDRQTARMNAILERVIVSQGEIHQALVAMNTQLDALVRRTEAFLSEQLKSR